VPVIHVDSIEDPRLEDYRFLRDRDLRRAEEGLFVGEQLLVVEQMLARPQRVRSVLVGESFAARVRPLVPDSVPLIIAPMHVLEAISGFPVHRGVLAIGLRSAVDAPSLKRLVPDGETTILLCEEIRNIDNVGQLFRTAAALGVDGVLLSPRCHDPLYRRCLRVSIGHVLTVPWRISDDWHRDLDRLRREFDLTLVAAATGDGAVSLDALPLPSRVGLLVGTEFSGLTDETLRRCDHRVRIPMAAGVDSLNVAVAAAICLHRLSRRNRS